MKKVFTFFIGCFLTNSMFGQVFQEISTGPGYTQQSFVRLGDDMQKQVANTSWDIAFSTASFDAGVFINESAGTSMGQAQTEVVLFDALSNDFSVVPDPSQFTANRLHNQEENWQRGAFNTVAAPDNPLDFGWGTYTPVSNTVQGEKVYVIQLRDASYRKIQIQQLANNTFSFRHAALDGSDEQTVQIDKSAYQSQLLAYYSFSSGIVEDVEPSGGFDLLYCRYTTPLLDPDSGDTLQYNVTGILLGRDVEAYKASGIDPATVDFEAYQDALSSRLDVIGHDWKTFTFTNGWLVPEDVAYFIKTADERVWKINFIDFEGASTGTTVLEKVDLGLVSSLFDTPGTQRNPTLAFQIAGNPHRLGSPLQIQVDNYSISGPPASVSIIDLGGRIVHQQRIGAPTAGSYPIQLPTLAAGNYFVLLRHGQSFGTQKLLIVR